MGILIELVRHYMTLIYLSCVVSYKACLYWLVGCEGVYSFAEYNDGSNNRRIEQKKKSKCPYFTFFQSFSTQNTYFLLKTPVCPPKFSRNIDWWLECADGVSWVRQWQQGPGHPACQCEPQLWMRRRVRRSTVTGYSIIIPDTDLLWVSRSIVIMCDTGLWLVKSEHMTMILSSDW